MSKHLKTSRSLLALVALVAVLVAADVWRLSTLHTQEFNHNRAGPISSAMPAGVVLQPIDGGPHYYTDIDPRSAWMDQHILLGAWLEEPMTAAEVGYDVAMGNNIYWNLASDPLDKKDCSGTPCRVNFNVIRAEGMHASAPDVTTESGSETVAYEGSDESDMKFGPGSNAWDKSGPDNPTSCVPSGSKCGYTIARYFYTDTPRSYGSTGHSISRKPIMQGYGKGVLFWETNTQAAQFLRYSDTLSADSYWMTDVSLRQPSQGACALMGLDSKECDHGNGIGLSYAEQALTSNYAFNVTRIRSLEARIGASKPITVDVETGCPVRADSCTKPVAAVSAAWHALIAGARGILWFQHNFGGPCQDFNTFYDGSNPLSSKYNCQQTPGVTLHNLVKKISAFNHQVARLNSVLLSPFAVNYVDTGDADVSVMAKYAHGTFYVFAGSGRPAQPPANNQPVTFHLTENYTGPVTVVGENRVLHAVNGVFADVFADSDSVHIYKIGQ